MTVQCQAVMDGVACERRQGHRGLHSVTLLAWRFEPKSALVKYPTQSKRIGGVVKPKPVKRP